MRSPHTLSPVLSPRGCRGGLLALLLAALAASAQAQTTPAATDTAAMGAVAGDTVPADTAGPPVPLAGVSPLLSPDHWAVAAVRRAEALGLVRGWVPAQRGAPRLAVGRALREAAEAARGSGDPRLAAMVQGWWARFSEELGEATGSPLRPLGAFARGGFRSRHGQVEPASGLYGYRVDPLPRRDQDDPAAALSASVGVGAHLAFLAEPSYDGSALRLDRWEAVGGWGPWSLSVGEMPVAYGVARAGGLVLSDPAFPRLEVRTERPLRLPGVLRHLGPVSAHTAITRFDETRHPGEPYFWAMRAAFQPHSRFTVGINRAALFGGDSIDTPVTLANVARMFVGILSRDFENQVVSVDGRFRVPSESVLPLTLYLEWGSEDASGAWWRVPGIVGGAFVPALPGLPEVGLGGEYTHFSSQCCGNPPWYFHGSFPGGWVLDGRPLGHPLGGEGSEALAYAVADLLESRLRLEGRAFARTRGERGLAQPQRAGNLYAPLRAGTSRGGSLSAAWRVAPRVDLRTSWYRDAGEGWAEQRLTADLSFLF